MTIYTIGHSNISFDAFLERLRMHGICVVADVRSVPVSRYVPHFNYEFIEMSLPREGIDYEFMGDRLGGRPRSPDYTKRDGTPDYEKMAEDELFIEGLDIMMRIAQRTVVCLMCSEEDPAKCHRAKLVSAQLALRGADVQHILADGALEAEEHNSRRRFSAAEQQLELF